MPLSSRVEKSKAKGARKWRVYMLRCRDNTLYTGVTTDVERRLKEHNNAKNGSRCTRSRLPVCLVYSEPQLDRASALKREAEIKSWRKEKKEEFLMRASEI